MPTFDITEFYSEQDAQDMLVNSVHLGAGLASKFANPQSQTSIDPTASAHSPSPDHLVVLMRRHGFTTLGKNIKETVYRAMYTHVNAGIQTNAMLLQRTHDSLNPTSVPTPVNSLTSEQCKACRRQGEGTQEKPWRLWVREVERNPLYTNTLAKY